MTERAHLNRCRRDVAASKNYLNDQSTRSSTPVSQRTEYALGEIQLFEPQPTRSTRLKPHRDRDVPRRRILVYCKYQSTLAGDGHDQSRLLL